MGNKADHLKVFAKLLQQNDQEQIIDYIKRNSNLPGPRGNLEMAFAFRDTISSQIPSKANELMQLCTEFTNFDSLVAPTNDPMEMVPFCGIIGIGRIGSLNEFHTKCLELVHFHATDERWRMREGIAMALSDLIGSHSEETISQLEIWMQDADWLIYRGIVAGFAEPKILRDEYISKTALRFHDRILEQVLMNENSKNEEFKVLVKALKYTVSVVAAVDPEAGFTFIDKWIRKKSKLISSIIKSNLQKNRLIKLDKDRVNLLLSRI